jgi:hypothetical protein
LTDEINERNYKEEINDRYISLVLNWIYINIEYF